MMAIRRAFLAAALPGLAGCAAPRPAADGTGWIRLPPEAGTGVAFDADRLAVAMIVASLTVPSRQAGDPVAQARALGWYEVATVGLAAPRWAGLDPMALLLLRRGRDEMRAAYGIRPDAPAQDVVDGFFSTATALAGGDRVAAARRFPPGTLAVPGDVVVARLQNPPRLPQVAAASNFAARATDSVGSGNVRGGG